MRITAVLILVISLTASVAAQTAVNERDDFDYIEADSQSNVLRTTHAAKFQITLARTFSSLGEFHHQAVYNDKKFNISMAVFRSGGDLLLVHAEAHADGSGGLDYSDLEQATLSGLHFTRRTQCASPEDAEELKSNPQISFIRSKGFVIRFPFQLEQFFATSKDGTSEVVISYGRAVLECSVSEGSKLRKDLEDAIEISSPEKTTLSN